MRIHSSDFARLSIAALLAAAMLVTPALAAGQSGSHGNSGNSNGGSSDNHGNSANANSASTSHGNSGSSHGSPQAVVRQYAISSGQNQGAVASLLKSWNSLNRNPQAFLNNINNPSSLPGKQAAYICDQGKSQSALTSFVQAGGSLDNPPTAPSAQDTIDYQAAEVTLATLPLGVTAADVLAAPSGTYPPDQVTAAHTVQNYDQALALYDAYQSYETAKGTADTAFKVASVSYSGSTSQATLDALRTSVDKIVATKFTDTGALCGGIASN